MKKVLLLEDETDLRKGIALALGINEIQISQAATKKEAIKLLNENRFDLGIFDINLPDGSGLDVLQYVRERGNMSVILLTAKDTEMDIVSGLEMGADDYIAKPFSLAVLRARVNTQLRRMEQAASRKYDQDGFSFDFDRLEFRKNERILEFSKTEQKLLKILVENRGITVARSKLLEMVWPDGTEYVDENALSVSIKRLRDKLEDTPSKPVYIKTIYGIGYQWVSDK